MLGSNAQVVGALFVLLEIPPVWRSHLSSAQSSFFAPLRSQRGGSLKDFRYAATGMRLALALGTLLLAGCAGPHSSGGLWAQQNLEREAALFRLSDAQRAQAAATFELSLADEILASERSRVETALQDCPGERRPLALSSGDTVRDTVRVRAQADVARLTALAQIALADWRIRRGQATGEGRFCDAARQALSSAPARASTPSVLDSLGEATVSRDGRQSAPAAIGEGEPLVQLSLYATQSVDAIRAMAPLPQYLAAVYGGLLTLTIARPDLDGQSPEAVVDDLAPAYPEWEPDALYAALSPQ